MFADNRAEKAHHSKKEHLIFTKVTLKTSNSRLKKDMSMFECVEDLK